MYNWRTTTYSKLDADENAVAAVTAKSRRIVSMSCFNPGGTLAYIQFFDAARADVTVGTTAPYFVIPLPAGGGIDGPCGPRQFSTAITYAVTATATGSGAPASDCIVQFDYL
jgi:hypothetical protein